MDHYTTLGIDKSASPEDIKKAYRKLASKHHPDKGGDTAMFQKIEEAYRILSDPNQRQQYDNPNQFMNSAPGGFNFNFGGDMSEIFETFMRARQQHHKPTYKTVLFFTLEQSYFGEEQNVNLNTHSGAHGVKIKIPRGVEDGTQMRYDNVIPNANLVVEFRAKVHDKFDRRGFDLYSSIDISVLDLIVGTTKQFDAINGKTFEINIKPKTNPVGMLRIAGQGMPIMNSETRYGDQIILIKPYMPDTIDESITHSILTSLQK